MLTDGQTITDNGALTFATGDSMNFYTYYGASQIVVNGTMTATGDTFTTLSGGGASIQVGSGGHLTAVSSTFNINQLSLNNASVYGSGDLTGDTFNLPVYVPYGDVQYLAGNVKFEQVYINANTLPAGQTLALNQIGTNTSSLQYVFPGGFTIASGATLNVAPSISVLLTDGQTITDNGDVDLRHRRLDELLFLLRGVANCGQRDHDRHRRHLHHTQRRGASIQVGSGGHLTASNSTIGVNEVSLNAGSTANLQFVTFATQLAINSGASINIHNDDLSSANATVVASGGSTTTIDLTNNFWGTLNTTQIAAKITDHTRNSSLPTVVYQPFLSEDATGVTAANAAATFSTASQSVALSATVISAAGLVNAGTATFTVLNGSAVVGTAVTSNVMNGVATAEYALPASTAGGVYTIQVVFSGTSSLLGSSDTSHSLTINDYSTSTAAASAATIFSASAQTVALSATVTSAVGIVSEGLETFTILSGDTVIGTPVSVNVSAGAAGANYVLPAGATAGTYTIQAVYDGTAEYGSSTDSSQTLTVAAATTVTAAAGATATFGDASVTLSATITSPAGTVNQGTETFTIFNGTTPVGSPVTVNVSSGAAGTNFSLPTGTPAGTYIIQAVFNGTTDFVSDTDRSQTLLISAAATTTAASSAIAGFGETSVTLGATVMSPAGVVDEGTETFSILNGTTLVGSAVTVDVSAGAASASYALPAGTATGSYTILAAFNATTNFGGSMDSSHTLTIAISAYPDLQVQGLAVSPTTILSGDTVDVTWNDADTGNAAVDSEFVDNLTVVDTTTSATLVDTAITYNPALPGNSPIAPGGSLPRSYSFTLPASFAGTGDLLFTVTTDADNQIIEFNPSGTGETNNTATLTATSILARYNVNSTADSGAGSLRDAIDYIDANGGGTTIAFNFGTGPQTIDLLSPLPAITAPLTIDGTTEPGYSNTPLIELDGAGAGAGAQRIDTRGQRHHRQGPDHRRLRRRRDRSDRQQRSGREQLHRH